MRIFAHLKRLFFLFPGVFSFYFSTSQTIQVSIGSAGVTETFVDTKFDPIDGGTINVGYINDGSSNLNDLLMVKLGSNHQIIWQKVIPNVGDDIFYRAIICANGDYIAAGQVTVAGVRTGYVCRIKRNDGSLIWSKKSTNPAPGGFFWDAIETSNNNIALVGTDNFATSVTNSFIVLLNSDGETIWSKVSSTLLADEIRSIAQLPNGNLILVGFYNPTAGNYHGTISEIDEMTATIISQNTYFINLIAPGGSSLLNSIWSDGVFVRNSAVLISYAAFNDFGASGDLRQCIFNYDQTTKNLTGNIYYHPGSGAITGLSFYPLANNDFLTSISSSSPTEVFVSRITSGGVVFDKKVNGSINLIDNMDVENTAVVFAGNTTNSDLDAYDLFSSVNFPTSASPCAISDNNTLLLQPLTLPATTETVVTFTDAAPIVDAVLVPQNLLYSANNICGFVLPVSLIDFNAAYMPGDGAVSLKWSTSGELNSNLFVIERSENSGATFASIGSVNAAKLSSSAVHYNFSDPNPLAGINLYRLRQVDLDGSVKYSDVRAVECNRKKVSDYSLSPVPANGFTFLKFEANGSRIINIDILDTRAQLVSHQKNNIDQNNPLKLNTSTLARGIYFIRIYAKGFNTVTEKLVVE